MEFDIFFVFSHAQSIQAIVDGFLLLQLHSSIGMADETSSKVILEFAFISQIEVFFEGSNFIVNCLDTWGEEGGIVSVQNQQHRPFGEKARIHFGGYESAFFEHLLDVLMPGTCPSFKPYRFCRS